MKSSCTLVIVGIRSPNEKRSIEMSREWMEARRRGTQWGRFLEERLGHPASLPPAIHRHHIGVQGASTCA